MPVQPDLNERGYVTWLAFSIPTLTPPLSPDQTCLGVRVGHLVRVPPSPLLSSGVKEGMVWVTWLGHPPLSFPPLPSREPGWTGCTPTHPYSLWTGAIEAGPLAGHGQDVPPLTPIPLSWTESQTLVKALPPRTWSVTSWPQKVTTWSSRFLLSFTPSLDPLLIWRIF